MKVNPVALCPLAAALIGCPAHAALVEFTFSGVITAASSGAAGGSPAWNPPAPFTSVQVGQAWSLRYVFETEISPSQPNPAVFQRAIRQFTLTIGTASLSQPALPGTFAPLGDITLTRSPSFHQYDAAIPIMSAPLPISAGVVLQDSLRTAISDASRPPVNLSLSAFDTRFFFLGPLNAQNQFRGTLTSFVPAPGLLALLGMFAATPLRRRER